MFATGNEERCSVMLFKVYLEKRPEEMKTTGPFYLSVIDKPVSNVWFKKTLMGKNAVDSIMKKMKLNSPLIDLCIYVQRRGLPTIVPERLGVLKTKTPKTPKPLKTPKTL